MLNSKYQIRPIALSLAVAFSNSVIAQDNTAAKTLPAITISGQAANSYVVPVISSATRTETPIEQIPQSVVVIPRAVIDDQGAQTLSDVLRNVSNVTALDARDSNLTGFKIRGFASATIVDGVATPGVFQNQESLNGVDQISVIKGPSGGLYGGSQGMNYLTIGGAVVISTVEPVKTPVRKVGLSTGTYGQNGVSFDLNQPVNDVLALRLTGEYSKTDSETERVYHKRTSLAPSIAVTPNADTKIVLRLRDTGNETLDYPGLPRAAAGSPDVITGIPRSRFIGAQGLPPTTNDLKGVNLQWNQRLNEKWDFNLTWANNKMELKQFGAFNASVIDAFVGGFFGNQFGLAAQDIYGYHLWQNFNSTTLAPALTGKFETGSAKHVLTLGIDQERSSEDAFLRFSDPFAFGISPFTGFVPVSLVNYAAPIWITPSPGNLLGFDSAYSRKFDARTSYIQDQITLGNWSLLGSVRDTRIDLRNTDTVTGAVTNRSNSKTTPRVGAVYAFSPNVSVFAGYSEAVKTPSLAGGFGAGVTPELEEVAQTEIGLRLKDLQGVTASFALFDLTRKNVVTSGGLAGNYFTDQAAKGIDIDLRWQMNSSWQWIAAYTSQSAEYTGTKYAQVASFVGKQLFNVPKQTARLAARYDIRQGELAGLGLGLGLTHQSKLPGDSTNSFFTPATTVWDGQVSYQMKAARLGLNVSNLFDKQYFVPSNYFGGGQVLPAAPRTVTATANFSF